MTREDGRRRYQRQIREMREELGIGYREAQRRWGQYFASGGSQIRPLRRLELAIRSILTDSRLCPFCRDEINSVVANDDPIYTCPNCRTQYHEECFEELGTQCPTLGCVTRPVVRIRRRATQREDDEWLSGAATTRILTAIVATLGVAILVCLIRYLVS